MGFKNFIRPLLPPTSRAFLNQTNLLLERLDAATERLRDLSEKTAHLEETNNQMLRRIHGLEEQNRRLSDQLRRTVGRKMRYSNLEYASKLGAGNTPDILLAGWYGAENFGDELMLSALVESFPKEARSRIAVLLWDNYTYPTDLIDPRVTILHYPCSTWELDQLANHFTTLVWGGGAILDDTQYDENPDNYNTGNLFIRLSKRMLVRGGRVFCLGLSTNDLFNNQEYIRELDSIVSDCELFSLRDPNSLGVLSRSGIDTSRVELCQDLAFASTTLSELPRNTTSFRDNPTRVAVVPLSIPGMSDHYIGVLNTLTQDQGAGSPYEVSLVPFLNDAGGHDARYCDALLTRLDFPERIRVTDFARTPKDLHLETYDLVIAYKYHAALIALSQGTPTLCIFDEHHPHYRNKMTYLAYLFAWEDFLSPASEFSKHVLSSVDTALSSTQRPSDCTEVMDYQKSWLADACRRIFD